MKICHITPTYFSKDSIVGGGERYVYNIVSSIAHVNNSEVEQIIISFSENEDIFYFDDVKVILLKKSFHSNNAMDNLSFDLYEKLESEDIDVIHLHQSLTLMGEYVLAVCSDLNIPIISTDLGGGSSDILMQHKGLEISSAIFSISKYAESLVRPYYLGESYVKIGPINTEFFKIKDNTIGKSSSSNKIKAICVSRLLPHKGIDKVISALSENISLTIVGQVYDDDYFNYLNILSKGKSVKFIHNASDDDLVRLYHDSDIFVQASCYVDCYGRHIEKPELMGLTTLEALACGLPVLISNAGSLPELIENTVFGRVFESEDELALIFKELNLLPWFESFVPIDAHDYVVKNFGMNAVANYILEMYKKTIIDFKMVN
ncbi:putative UDP-Glycosyltransferase/glycogen phosphorylase [Vibrio cholerae]|nr:putative glycosyltransferase [Vibrio cholerae]GHX57850.1 putative UDP-Glycosyltransferase/glycogen phosphorylase [Vibrio cholerae]HAS3586165.1 glycosyltransferase family 4 protein [Vibrio cholerae]